MFGSLKNLFGSNKAEATQHIPQDTPATPPNSVSVPSAFLARNAVFDRKNRPAGHLFFLSDQAIDDTPKQRRQLDLALLDALNTSPEAWNTSQAFLILSSSSLDLPALDHLKTSKVSVLIDLAPDADPAQLVPRLEALRQRGLSLGIVRQPQNPAFTPTVWLADFGVIDVANNEATSIRDFSAAFRAAERSHPAQLLGFNIESADDHRFCHQWHFDYFHGPFAASIPRRGEEPGADPHKFQLLNLLRLVQGDAETDEITAAMKQDPLIAFRILRYLNSAALGFDHHIDSLAQALVILGRKKLTRWLAVLLFSVREPNIGDWLLVESALTRGRMMEALGSQLYPGQPSDPLFLTGIFSCLDRLMRRPLAELLNDMPLSTDVRRALLEHSGPYATLLAVAEACDSFDLTRMESTASAAGLDSKMVNHALLAATAWASEVTEHWE